MACTWTIAFNHPPETETYTHLSIAHPNDPDVFDGQHTHLTNSYLTPSHSIPGIPDVYTLEQAQGRALYLSGLPKSWENSTVRDIFQFWGNVEKVPVLISVSAEEVFRWVIMGSREEAELARAELHGRKFQEGMGRLIVSESLPPGRTITMVGRQMVGSEYSSEGEETMGYEYSFEGEQSMGYEYSSEGGQNMGYEYGEYDEYGYEDQDNTPVQELFHGHPPLQFGMMDMDMDMDMGEDRTPRSSAFEFVVEDTDAEESFNAEIISPEIPQPSKVSPVASPRRDSVVKNDENVKPAPVSWANITASAAPENKLVDLAPKRAVARLRPVGRIPTVTRTDHSDKARLVFLFNLPANITITDVSNAVKEGPLIKLSFGVDENTKKRFCGVIFQHSRDAAAFQESLDKEKRLSRPERFRFIVDHARAVQEDLEESLKVMGPPIYATRRLTIVKAGFFFMFGERQLRDMCNKLVGEEAIQLIWLYNGGNATVVFTDVSAAVKVKNEFDRRAYRATSGGEGSFAVWEGVYTSFSKDPCVVPLELKTAMQTQ